MEDATIQTERLRLVPQAVEHADEMVAVLADPELYRFTGGGPLTLRDLRERFARQAARRSPDGTQEWRNWILVRRSDDAAVGAVQTTISGDGHTADVAWVVGTVWQGNGYAAEAARALVAWLLARSVRTIQAKIHPDHAASEAVASSAGLTPTEEMHAGERLWRLRAGGPTGSIRFPILTERLRIRPTIEADAHALHDVWGDPRVMGRPIPTERETLELLRTKIAQQDLDGFSMWTVEERATGRVVGTVGLQYEDGPEIGLGFLFAPASWGRGYGREAAAATLRAGFEQLGLDRIMGITGDDNAPARRLMEAIAMTHRGTARYYSRDWALYEVLRPPSAEPAPESAAR